MNQINQNPVLSTSKTPTGPFQRIVFELKTTSFNCSNVFGPASKPCHPAGISATLTICVFASFENESAITTSIGK